MRCNELPPSAVFSSEISASGLFIERKLFISLSVWLPQSHGRAGAEPRPVHWGCRVLVPGLPGKSLPLDFLASLTRSHTLSPMTVDPVGHHVGSFLSVLHCSCPEPIYVRPQTPLLPYSFGCLCFALRGLILVSPSAG